MSDEGSNVDEFPLREQFRSTLEWVSNITNETLLPNASETTPAGKFASIFKDGTVLCRLARAVFPECADNELKSFKVHPRLVFSQLDNINKFKRVCEGQGILPEPLLPVHSQDVTSGHNTVSLLRYLQQIRRATYANSPLLKRRSSRNLVTKVSSPDLKAPSSNQRPGTPVPPRSSKAALLAASGNSTSALPIATSRTESTTAALPKTKSLLSDDEKRRKRREERERERKKREAELEEQRREREARRRERRKKAGLLDEKSNEKSNNDKSTDDEDDIEAQVRLRQQRLEKLRKRKLESQVNLVKSATVGSRPRSLSSNSSDGERLATSGSSPLSRSGERSPGSVSPVLTAVESPALARSRARREAAEAEAARVEERLRERKLARERKQKEREEAEKAAAEAAREAEEARILAEEEERKKELDRRLEEKKARRKARLEEEERAAEKRRAELEQRREARLAAKKEELERIEREAEEQRRRRAEQRRKMAEEEEKAERERLEAYRLKKEKKREQRRKEAEERRKREAEEEERLKKEAEERRRAHEEEMARKREEMARVRKQAEQEYQLSRKRRLEKSQSVLSPTDLTRSELRKQAHAVMTAKATPEELRACAERAAWHDARSTATNADGGASKQSSEESTEEKTTVSKDRSSSRSRRKHSKDSSNDLRTSSTHKSSSTVKNESRSKRTSKSSSKTNLKEAKAKAEEEEKAKAEEEEKAKAKKEAEEKAKAKKEAEEKAKAKKEAEEKAKKEAEEKAKKEDTEDEESSDSDEEEPTLSDEERMRNMDRSGGPEMFAETEQDVVTDDDIQSIQKELEKRRKRYKDCGARIEKIQTELDSLISQSDSLKASADDQEGYFVCIPTIKRLLMMLSRMKATKLNVLILKDCVEGCYLRLQSFLRALEKKYQDQQEMQKSSPFEVELSDLVLSAHNLFQTATIGDPLYFALACSGNNNLNPFVTVCTQLQSLAERVELVKECDPLSPSERTQWHEKYNKLVTDALTEMGAQDSESVQKLLSQHCSNGLVPLLSRSKDAWSESKSKEQRKMANFLDVMRRSLAQLSVIRPSGNQVTIAEVTDARFAPLSVADLEVEETVRDGPRSRVVKARYFHEVVALKTLKDGSDVGTRRFIGELSRLRSVYSGYITSLYGWSLAASPPIIVTEYLERGSLHSVLYSLDAKTGKVLDLPLALRWRILCHICLGVAYMHANGLVHGGLSSHHVVISRGFRAKLCSLGGHTNMQPYADPSKHAAEKPGDIFSYGVLMYEVALRDPSFFSLSADAFPIAAPESMPKELANLMGKCMKRSYSSRPNCMQAIKVYRKMGLLDNEMTAVRQEIKALIEANAALREEIKIQEQLGAGDQGSMEGSSNAKKLLKKALEKRDQAVAELEKLEAEVEKAKKETLEAKKVAEEVEAKVEALEAEKSEILSSLKKEKEEMTRRHRERMEELNQQEDDYRKLTSEQRALARKLGNDVVDVDNKFASLERRLQVMSRPAASLGGTLRPSGGRLAKSRGTRQTADTLFATPKKTHLTVDRLRK